jgi:hypothetical protein
MRRGFLAGLAGIVLLSVGPGTAPLLKGSEAQKKESNPKASTTEDLSVRPANVYRVDYVLHELENGKRTNTRNYTLMVSAAPVSGVAERGGDWTGFHVGSRVPISMGHEQYQYFDLGVKINCRLKERESDLLVETSLEVNSVAAPESGSVSTTASPAGAPQTPVIRSLSLSSITQAVPGTAALVGSVDDVTANRRYEIEVIPAKVQVKKPG